MASVPRICLFGTFCRISASHRWRDHRRCAKWFYYYCRSPSEWSVHSYVRPSVSGQAACNNNYCYRYRCLINSLFCTPHLMHSGAQVCVWFGGFGIAYNWHISLRHSREYCVCVGVFRHPPNNMVLALTQNWHEQRHVLVVHTYFIEFNEHYANFNHFELQFADRRENAMLRTCFRFWFCAADVFVPAAAAALPPRCEASNFSSRKFINNSRYRFEFEAILLFNKVQVIDLDVL